MQIFVLGYLAKSRKEESPSARFGCTLSRHWWSNDAKQASKLLLLHSRVLVCSRSRDSSFSSETRMGSLCWSMPILGVFFLFFFFFLLFPSTWAVDSFQETLFFFWPKMESIAGCRQDTVSKKFIMFSCLAKQRNKKVDSNGNFQTGTFGCWPWKHPVALESSSTSSWRFHAACSWNKMKVFFSNPKYWQS